MNDQTTQCIDEVELKLDAVIFQVEKLARLVYKVFKRLPRRVETPEEVR